MAPVLAAALPAAILTLGAALAGLWSAPPGPGAALALLAGALFLTATGLGRGAAGLLRLPLPVELEALLGLVLVAHLAMLPAMTGWPHALVAAPVGGLALLGLFGRRGEAARPGELLALGAALGFALLWAGDSAARFALFAEGGPFRPWVDSFVHAGTIAEFGDPRAIGRGTSGLADVPAVVYHAASHALAALAVRFAGLAPLDAVAGFWLPVGAVAMGLGVFALGRALAGVAGGALGCAALALVPDAAAYGLRQGFFSFHWMMEISPGSLYGLGAALGCIALLLRWTAERRAGWLALSVLLLAGSFLLRAHIFVWLVVPWLVTLWLALPYPARRMRLALLGLGSVAGVPALLWIARAEIASVGLGPFLTRYLDGLHVVHAPTAYDGFYPALVGQLGASAAAPFGVGLALLGMSGVWLFTFGLGAALAARRGLLRAGDALPLALLAWAGALQLLAPTPYHGDVSDFRQRAFVLVHAVLMVWSAAFLARLWPVAARPRLAAGAAWLALLVTPFWLADAKPGRMAWVAGFADLRLTPGLPEAAAWIRAEAGPGESLLVAGLRAEELLFDDAAALAGMSGVPAWLSRPAIMLASGPPRAAIAAERMALAASLHAGPDAQEAWRTLQAARVGFYVARSGDPPAWDRAAALASLRAGDLVVWRVPR